MKADYDSQADALLIDLADVDRCDQLEAIGGSCCEVSLRRGSPANIELLYPSDHLDLLDLAAERFGIDGEAMRAAAHAAMAAPDRPITIDVADRIPY